MERTGDTVAVKIFLIAIERRLRASVAALRGRLKRWLGSPAAPWFAVAAALLLTAPSLTTGLCADDWLHQLIACGRADALPGLPTSRLDLFAFAGRDPSGVPRLIEDGLFPWWTDRAVELAFWRPLSSLTHLLDWVAWPHAPWLMHLHSLAWFGLALVAVAAFYRRFLGAGAVAGLATLLYAVDDAHGPAVGWIANRNAMIALALALPVVIVYDRGRRDRWAPAAWLGPALFGVALLAGESALAAAAYLAAHALVLDRARWRERLAALAPYGGVVVAWRLVYHALGYGTAHSGVYLDPAAQPARFLAELPARAVSLLASQLALPWSDFAPLWTFVSPHFAAVMLAIATATVALFVAVLWPLGRREPVARFFALGTLLALVPICSTVPADRLLWFVGVGAMGVIALFVARARGVAAGAFAALLVTIHLVLAPPLLALRSRSMVTMGRAIARADDSVPHGAAVAGQTVVLVNPPADPLAGYLPLRRAARGEPLPRLRWLATGERAVTLERTDARTLLVRPDGGFLRFVSEQLLVSPDHPPPLGARVRLSDVEIEVTAVEPDGRPAEARARFDRPLEDPSLRWFVWRDNAYRPWTPPPVGARVTLPPVDLGAALFAP